MIKFRDLFEDIEEWFWKLEFNPESNSYELYMGIPNDWEALKAEIKEVDIELIHKLEQNMMIKIFTTGETSTIDDVIETAKLIVALNKELERKKEEHRKEMERLRDLLIEKQKNFDKYVNTVKGVVEDEEEKSSPSEEVEIVVETENDGVSDGANEGVNDGVNPENVNNFMEDIKK